MDKTIRISLAILILIGSAIHPVLLFAEGNLPKDVFPDIYWGFVYPLRFTVVDEDHHAVNITGWTIVLEVYEDQSDLGTGTNPVINKTCTISSPTAGQCYVVLSAADTKWVGGVEANGNINVGTTYYAYVIKTADANGSTRRLLLRSFWVPAYA